MSDRPPALRRVLLFVAGADADTHARAIDARPDVLIQDLEDFTPAQLKRRARELGPTLYERARDAGIMPAVRINALEDGGRDDLAEVIDGQPSLVLLPKAESAADVAALSALLDVLESQCGFDEGSIEIVPNAETAAGVLALGDMARASDRVKSALLATEDLAADLCAERSPDALELAYARSRFLFECRALGIEPIDAPYTYSDVGGCEREVRASRRLGYRSKSAVRAEHVAAVRAALTPTSTELAHAHRVVDAFLAARHRGEDRALVDGLWIEPPAYRTALRLIERAAALA